LAYLLATFGLIAFLSLLLGPAPPAAADDPALAGNDFGNNGESSVPSSAYEPGKKVRESEEYKKENPDQAKRDYYEKGGEKTNHDGKCRAKVAYKAARYKGPKNGYESGTTTDSSGHSDGPRPKAGGGDYEDSMPTDPAEIAHNVYKFVEDVTYPKKQPNPFNDDGDICNQVESGAIDVGKASTDQTFMCIETIHFFTSLMRELGFPVREKNVLPSFSDGTYDVQTAAANVYYDGEWHFFDPWESFTSSTDYLTEDGHAGYVGPDSFHDVDIWIRESAPTTGDYGFTKGGTTPYPGWKKITTHKENGAKIETRTFAVRLGVRDADGLLTGGTAGVAVTEIPDSLYVPWDREVQESHALEPGPEVYGAELVTLLYAYDEPPGIHDYELELFNPSPDLQEVTVDLQGLPWTVDVRVEPPVLSAVLAPGDLVSFPFQVTIGRPLSLPPAPVSGARVASVVGNDVTLEWDPSPGAVEYRVYAAPELFEDPSEPGVELLGVAAAPPFAAWLDAPSLLAVEAVGEDGQTSGFSAEGGSTTWAEPDAVGGPYPPGEQTPPEDELEE
jgi:hypothetical protein